MERTYPSQGQEVHCHHTQPTASTGASHKPQKDRETACYGGIPTPSKGQDEPVTS